MSNVQLTRRQRFLLGSILLALIVAFVGYVDSSVWGWTITIGASVPLSVALVLVLGFVAGIGLAATAYGYDRPSFDAEALGIASRHKFEDRDNQNGGPHHGV